MRIVEETEAYGEMIEPATLRVERLLPGPVERVWAYLTESEKRKQWLAAGPMELVEDGSFKLTWRNHELTDPPGARPEGFGEEHSMDGTILEVVPLKKLRFTWGDVGEVTFLLEPVGSDVRLTLVQHRTKDRNQRIMVGAGWHAHLAILKAKLEDRQPAEGFWDLWLRLKADYEGMIKA